MFKFDLGCGVQFPLMVSLILSLKQFRSFITDNTIVVV